MEGRASFLWKLLPATAFRMGNAVLALAGAPACDPSEGCVSSLQTALVSGGRLAFWRITAPEDSLASKPGPRHGRPGPRVE